MIHKTDRDASEYLIILSTKSVCSINVISDTKNESLLAILFVK